VAASKPQPQPQPSPPFASREFNGEVLLDELDELRNAQLAQKHLTDVVLGLRDVSSLRVSDACLRLKQLASNRFAGQPALASLLVRWAAKLKTEADVLALVGHFERLALTSAIVSALRRGAERLPKAGRE
jgi:hypothetical protein